MSTNAPTSRFGFAPDSNARKMRLEVFYFIYNLFSDLVQWQARPSST